VASTGTPDPQQSAGESKQLAQDVHWITHATFWSQIGLGVIGIFALWIYSGQLDEMRKATVASTKATQLASDALEYSDSHFDRAQQQTITQTVAAIKAANAAKSAADIARESMESAQRAYVALHSIEFTRGKTGNQPYWSVQPYWENSGSTPAIHAIANYTVLEGRAGITEEMFKSSGTPATQSRLVETVIASKAVQGGVVASLTEADLFGMNLGDNFENFTNTHQRDDVWIFGWMVYRDILAATKDHLTEFCRHMEPPGLITGVPPAIKYNLSTCPTHNCQDEYCTDYAEIVAYAESRPTR